MPSSLSAGAHAVADPSLVPAPDAAPCLDPAGLPDRLVRIGLTPALAARLTAAHTDGDPRDAQPMRVTAVHRDAVALHDGDVERAGRVAPARLRAWLDADDPLAVGDWVLARVGPDGAATVRARAAPTNRLVRRDGDGHRHVVAANLDLALLVMGLDDDWNLRRLERYLALVAASAIEAMVVLTKLDVASREPARLDARLAAMARRLHDVSAIAVDGTDPVTAARLAPALQPGRTLVLLGSSGAGKSTLANTLLGHAVQDTGPVRAHDSRGMHTTTARTLHRLPGGACIVDTPGVRTLRVDGDAEALAAGFADVAERATQCRFRDCTHDSEPGCAVRAHVDADRLRNHRKLLREVARDGQTWHERRQQLGVWKAQGRAARERMRHKRGD